MPAFRFSDFLGMMPMRSERGLPPNGAQLALNATLRSGELRGIREPKLEVDLAAAVAPILGTVYRAVNTAGAEKWLAYVSKDVDIVRSPLTLDSFDRHYIAVPGAPIRVWNWADINTATAARALGVPGPLSDVMVETVGPIVLTSAGPSGGVSVEEEYRSWVITFVNAYGEESAPSAPTAPQLYRIDDPGTLLAYAPLVPASIIDDYDITRTRLYRTVSGLNGATTYHLVADVGVNDSGGSLADAVSTLFLTTRPDLESAEWDMPPPVQEGMVLHPAGFLVAWQGRDLFFSERYRPHAWPTSYILTLEHDVVAMVVLGNALVAGTRGDPVLLQGSDPAQVVPTRLVAVEPCLSKRAMVSMLGPPASVLYASPNGVVQVGSNGLTLLTRALIDDTDWKARYQSTTTFATRWGTAFLAFTGVSGQGYILDLEDDRNAFSEIAGWGNVTGASVDARSGRTLIQIAKLVLRWGDPLGNPLPFLWRGGELVTPRPVNLGAAMVDILGTVRQPAEQDEYTVYRTPALYQDLPAALSLPNGVECVFRLWADYKLVFEGPVTSRAPFRLSSGFKATVWQAELVSYRNVAAFELADTMREIGRA